MPRTSHAAVAAAVVFVAFSAWLLSGTHDPETVKAVDQLTFVALALVFVVVATLAAMSSDGRLRTAWTLMTVGAVAWLVGDILWAYYGLLAHRAPFPSPKDAAFLVFPLAVCVALLLFPTGRTAADQARLVLDGIIVAGALFLISWLIVMRKVFLAGAPHPTDLVVSLAYPITDVILLTVCALVMVRVTAGLRVALMLLTAGLACEALADTAFTYLVNSPGYESGNFIDIIWIGAVLLIIVACVEGCQVHDDGDVTPVLPAWASLWMPYALLLVSAVFVANAPLDVVMEPPVLMSAMIIVVAVLVRQVLDATTTRRLLTTAAEDAVHDPLTGLANRALLGERLEKAMQRHRRDGSPVTVIALDLNDFKVVNDSMGHAAGDELLRSAAGRIQTRIRPTDIAARTGGDEFAVLVEGCTESAYLVAYRLMEAFDEPFLVAGNHMSIRPSLGLAVAGDEERDLAGEDLLSRADTAMYTAKRSRSAAVHTYFPGMGLAGSFDAEQVARGPSPLPGAGEAAVRLLSDLRRAVDDGDLEVFYQPKFDLRSARIVGVEALLRWPHREHGLLRPDEFLPLIRRHGLMGTISEFVLNRSLDDARRWHDAGAHVPVAVNMFAPSLMELDLPDRISRALAERGLSASSLTVEITEDLLLDTADRTQSVLKDLRRRGIRIAIDDFGTGYATLSYLRDLPLDEVKIDCQFIVLIKTDPRTATIVRSVVDLAHALGMTVVAEGVEDMATADMLRGYGCDEAQGHYYSPPVRADALITLCRQRRADSTDRQTHWNPDHTEVSNI